MKKIYTILIVILAVLGTKAENTITTYSLTSLGDAKSGIADLSAGLVIMIYQNDDDKRPLWIVGPTTSNGNLSLNKTVVNNITAGYDITNMLFTLEAVTDDSGNTIENTYYIKANSNGEYFSGNVTSQSNFNNPNHNAVATVSNKENAAKIVFSQGNKGAGNFLLTPTGTSIHLNVQSRPNGQWYENSLVNWWGGIGGFSQWIIYEPTYTTTQITQYTVTWNINFNGTTTTKTSTVASGEDAIAPEADYPFTTITPVDAGAVKNITDGKTINATYTFNTPFTASTDYATATWYYIGSANKEHSSVNQPAYIYYNSESSNTIPFGSKTNSAAYKWAFIGNPINGYQIINKAAGEKNYVYGTSNSAPHIANTEQNDGWKVAEAHFGKETSRTAFGININGGDTYWNAGAQNITYYGFDDGSHWFVEEALQDESITLHESDGKMYATTCQPIAFSLSEGVTAYKVTEAINSDSETGTATLTAIDGDIPAGEPVVLIADNTNTTSVELTPSSDNTLEKSTDNKLQGVLSATAPTTTNYYFGQFGGKPGFYHTNINSVSSIKNKAYLPSDFAGANAASKGYAFSFGDDDVTGINSATETATTADENATRYNLQGQRVGKDAKGIIIIGGKKYIIK